ncbi:ABC transporter ATP-binding protein [Cellulomonas chitinilytica]|uniref:ABC transporter ATP-binding protein n=1 Tax=Cellulomonas chitinilytica TaxID=398759 RepID=A0A919P0V5_9CELL|nr:ABC transporter ATP-binding protein [Cellulomonas chitinilytica]GIG19768.1 ABC transporter ATP-binding protein [Cellulomonas chitinilytica]
MTAAIETVGLGKRYGRVQALDDCTVTVPTGRVVGLVGPNGAGKSTLLQILAGLLTPTTGSVSVLGSPPGGRPEQLARVGFVAQDTPTYATLTVSDHLRFGAHLNPGWDQALAADRIKRLGLDPAQRADRLSGGQRAQLALTVAMAKRPELLLLDEPVASLDPLARRDFLGSVMEFVADHDATVVLSSHVVADLERICDHLVLLSASHVQVAGDVEDLLSSHHRLTGRRRSSVPAGSDVVSSGHTDRQSTLVVRSTAPVLDPTWIVDSLDLEDLEDLVLAYMSQDVVDAHDLPMEATR